MERERSSRFNGFGGKAPPVTFWGWVRKVMVLVWHCLIHFFNYVLPEALRTIFFSFPTAIIAAVTADTDTTMESRRGRGLRLLTQNKTPFPLDSREPAYDKDVHRCFPLKVFGFDYANVNVDNYCTEDYTFPLYSGHLHTIFGGLVRRRLRAVEEMNYDLEIVRSPFDGCTIYLDWRYADGVRPLQSSPFSVHHPLCDLTPDATPAISPAQSGASKLFRGSKKDRPRRASAGMNPGMSETDEESFLNEEETAEEELFGDGGPPSARSSNPSSRRASRSPSFYTLEPDDLRSNTSASAKNNSQRRAQYARGIIVIVPGMASDSRSNYIQRFILHAASRGFHCMIANTRGMGYTPPVDRPLTACGAFVQDIRGVFDKHLTEEYIRSRFGYLHPKYDEAFDDYQIIDSDDDLDDEALHASVSFSKPLLTREVYLAKRRLIPVVGLGFSLGGAQLTKYLGEDRELTRVHVGAAICSPWDPIETANNFVKPFQKAIYHREFLISLVEYVLKNRDVLLKHHPKESVREHLTELFAKIDKGWLPEAVMELDKQITCPIHGYNSIDEYYLDSSPLAFLHKIEVPMLCFTAMDDPVTGPPPHKLRLEDLCDLNDRILFVTCPVGGHLGFMKGPIDEWLERPSFMEERVITSLTTACRQRIPKPVRRDITRAPADYSWFQRFGGRQRFVELLEEMEAERTREAEAGKIRSAINRLAAAAELPVSINLQAEMEELPSLENVMVQEYAMLSMAATQNMFMYRTRTAGSVGGSWRSAKASVSRSVSMEPQRHWVPTVGSDSPVFLPSDTDSPTQPDLSDTGLTSNTLNDIPLARALSDVVPKHSPSRQGTSMSTTPATVIPPIDKTSPTEDKPASPLVPTTTTPPALKARSAKPKRPPLLNEPFGPDVSAFSVLQCVCCQQDYPLTNQTDDEYCNNCIGRGCADPRPGGLIAAVRWRWNCQRRYRLGDGSPNITSPASISASRRLSHTASPTHHPSLSLHRTSMDATQSPPRSPAKRRTSMESSHVRTTTPTKRRLSTEAVTTAGSPLTPSRRRTSMDPAGSSPSVSPKKSRPAFDPR